jgi:hypothetical protein
MRYELNAEQAHRLTSAAVLLQLLESQLREELNILQSTLASTEAKPPPLTKGMTDRLEKTKVTVEMLCDQPRCPICSEDYVVPEDVLRIPCSHYFHNDCVMPWLEAKRTCPMCRYELCNEVPPREELRKLTLDELKARIHNHEQGEDEGEGRGEGEGEGALKRSSSLEGCFEREVLVERYHDLLVKEKESHERMEARARGGGGLGSGGGMEAFNQLMERQRMARMMQHRTSGAADGTMQMQASPFHHHRHHQGFPVGSLMGRTDGGGGASQGGGVWLQQSGAPGMRVLRIAPGPGSTASAMQATHMASHHDDDGFPPFNHPMNGSGTGMRMMMRRIAVDDDDDDDDDDADDEGEGDGEGGSGASGSLPSVRMISYPNRGHLSYGSGPGSGGLTHANSMPTRLVLGGRNVPSTASTSTMPTRTTYILRTVSAAGSGGSTAVYEPQPVVMTTRGSGGGEGGGGGGGASR